MKLTSYWDKYSSNYSDNWEKYDFRKTLSLMERDFIYNAVNIYLADSDNLSYLDLGCGTGRILDFMRNGPKRLNRIYAADASLEMINVCKNRFGKNSGITYFHQDITAPLTVKLESCDVVTCIRVLKYNAARESVFNNISKVLKSKGIFVFTITNKKSIAFFDRLPVAHYKDDLYTVTKQLNKAGLSVKVATGYQRIPEFVYILFSKFKAGNRIFQIETFLRKIYGEIFLNRVIYIVAQKD